MRLCRSEPQRSQEFYWAVCTKVRNMRYLFNLLKFHKTFICVIEKSEEQKERSTDPFPNAGFTKTRNMSALSRRVRKPLRFFALWHILPLKRGRYDTSVLPPGNTGVINLSKLTKLRYSVTELFQPFTATCIVSNVSR